MAKSRFPKGEIKPRIIKVIAPKPHKSKTIVLKTAEIDLKMIPVVKWLNSFRDIYTWWCCEGDDKGDIRQGPFVVFTCMEQFTLAQIARCLGSYGVIEVDWYEGADCIRYSMKFDDQLMLDRFVKESHKLRKA